MKRWSLVIPPLLAALGLWLGFSLWVAGDQAHGLSFGQVQARLFGDWLDWRMWNTPSINRVEIAGGEALVSPVLAVAAWVALSAVLLVLQGVVRARRSAASVLAAVAMVTAAGWLLLDLRWQGELLFRLMDTRSHFSGLDWEQRRAADFDGDVFEFMQRLKAYNPDPAARFWIFSELEILHYRARYHAMPRPAHSLDQPLSATLQRRMRAGDYVVLLDGRVVRPGSVRHDMMPAWRGESRRFELADAVGRHARLGRDEVIRADGGGELLRLSDYSAMPGFYRLQVELRSADAGAESARLQVLYRRPGREAGVVAERRVTVDADQWVGYQLPFLAPASGELELRVVVDGEGDVRAGGLAVEWLQEQRHLVFLASDRDGPYVVARPVMRSSAGTAYEVL